MSLDNGSGRGKSGVRGNLEEKEGYAQGRKRVCRRLMSVLEEFSRSGGVHWSVIFGVCASGGQHSDFLCLQTHGAESYSNRCGASLNRDL